MLATRLERKACHCNEWWHSASVGFFCTDAPTLPTPIAAVLTAPPTVNCTKTLLLRAAQDPKRAIFVNIRQPGCLPMAAAEVFLQNTVSSHLRRVTWTNALAENRSQ